MFYILLIINALYVLIELYFNISLLNIASGTSNFDDIHDLELFGRALSSFGFTFIFWKIISIQKTISTKTKMFLILIVSIIIYPLFYYGQMSLINHFSNRASSELKKNSFALVLVKDGIRNGNLDLGIKSYSKNTFNTPESKTFSILNGIILLHNDTSLKFIESNLTQLSYSIFRAKSIENGPEIYEKTKITIKNETDYFWNNYTLNRHKITSQYDNSISLMSKNYSKINVDVKLLWSSYSRWAKRYNRVLGDYYGAALENDLKSIPRCKNIECFDNIINHNEKNVQNGLMGQKEKSSTFRMNADIYLSRRNSRPNIYSIKKICTIQNNGNKAVYIVKDSGSIKKYTFNMQGHFIKGFYCEIDRDEMKIDFIDSNKSSILNNLHTFNFEHSNINSFLRDKMIQDFLDSSSISKGGIPLPKPFPINSEREFKNRLLTDKEQIVSKILSDEIKKKMNITISGNIKNKNELMESLEFSEVLKAKLGNAYFDGINENMSKEKFMSYFVKKFATNTTEDFIEKYNKSDEYNENGNLQVKSIIVPPVALSLSLFFTLVNGGILVLSLLKIFIKNEYLYSKVRIFMIFLILTLIISPIFNDNSFSRDDAYQIMIAKLKKENIVLGYCIDWTMKAEPMIVSFIEKIKSINTTDTK